MHPSPEDRGGFGETAPLQTSVGRNIVSRGGSVNTLRTFLSARPWLLVVLAFVILIFGWAITFHLSGSVPGKRLTAEEEAAVLERRGPR